MNAVDAISPSAKTLDQFTENLIEFTHEQTGRWIELCDQFLRWQRENVIKVEPSKEILGKHRRALAWLLRATRIMSCQVSDPDFPDHQMNEKLSTLLWRLEDSWEMIYEPMSDKEADSILSRVFPE